MKFISTTFLIIGLCCNVLLAQINVNIIPKPVRTVMGEGFFNINGETTIRMENAKRELKPAAGFLSNYVKEISGYQLKTNGKTTNAITLSLVTNNEIGEEGYLLKVTSSEIKISANTKGGLVYGMQSLFQTLPQIRTNAQLMVPAMEITDYPRFKWRGMHMDVSRHFFSPEMVKEYIDLLATYKLNTLHWHLVDDQGWRIEIEKYPKLTSVGAWRVDRTDLPWAERPVAKAGEPTTYGGYYTQQQIKEMIKYAAERNVTIVPEIEMPGHVASAITAYPFLSCTQAPQFNITGGNYSEASSNYCAGNEETYKFLENVLDEVVELFPSKYIHLGGDEVDKTSWKNCPKCQAKMKAEGLKDVDELQSYFMRRMEKYLISKKKKMIGWDEILEGGLAPEATVMSWRGEAGGIAAAKMKHDVVMTPGNPVYFDHYQAGPEGEPLAIGGFNTLKMVYDYEPIPKELDSTEAKYVLGAQANVWAEYITTREQLEYMVLPRMLALSEVVWTPKANKDWLDFNNRLAYHFRGFEQKGLHFSRGNFKVSIKALPQEGKVMVNLATDSPLGEIYYTLNGNQPTIADIKYTAPFAVDSTLTLKAVTVINGKVMGTTPAEQHFSMHKAVGKDVVYKNPVSSYYLADGPNSLTDGVRGGFPVGKYWHGFSGVDVIATVDLGEVKEISSMTLGALQNYSDWIFLPKRVYFESSMDGITFDKVAKVENPISVEQKLILFDFKSEFAPKKARFVRAIAENLGGGPKNHPAEGKSVWIFVDEFIVN